ncbi:sensor domain-containing diguanylate cyclase [bacterium]|nr:sensor domain-containing diguanylate cyclase [bacterium]
MADTLSSLSYTSDLLDAMPDAIVIVNNLGSILLVNKQTEILFGYHRSDLLGQMVEFLIPMKFRKNHVAYRKNYTKNPQVRPMGTGRELYGLKKDGTEFPVDISLSPLDIKEGKFTIASIRDSTDHKLIEKKLKNIAEHDPLTGLVNMPLFKDRVAHGIELAKRNKEFMAVFFVDLDGFKQINDNYGHETGDLLLCEVGHCLQTCVRKIDTVARVGGDEFALSILEIKNENDVVEIVKKIINHFSAGFIINDKNLTITLSIGVSLYPNDGHQSLIEKADSAMYYVKKHGKNNFKLFDNLCHL